MFAHRVRSLFDEDRGRGQQSAHRPGHLVEQRPEQWQRCPATARSPSGRRHPTESNLQVSHMPGANSRTTKRRRGRSPAIVSSQPTTRSDIHSQTTYVNTDVLWWWHSVFARESGIYDYRASHVLCRVFV